MKRSGKLLLLIGILLLIVIAAIVTRNQVLKSAKIPMDDAVSLMSFDPQSVTRMSLSYGGEKNTFARVNGTWVYPEDEQFPLSAQKLDTLLTNLTALQSSQWIDAAEALSEYGLGDPWCKITVTAADQNLQVTIGNETTISGKRYASNGDGKIYIITNGQANAFTFRLLDLVQPVQAPAVEQVNSICLTGTPEEMLIRHDESGWFLISEEAPAEVDPQKMNKLISGILTTVFTDCVAYKPDDDTLHKFGMDGDLAVIILEYTAGDENGVYQLEFDPKFVYGRCVGSDLVYQLGDGLASLIYGFSATNLLL